MKRKACGEEKKEKEKKKKKKKTELKWGHVNLKIV